MSSADDADDSITAAPVQITIDDMATAPLLRQASATTSGAEGVLSGVGSCLDDIAVSILGGIRDCLCSIDICTGENCLYYLHSCVFYFFNAITTVTLHLCCCQICLHSCVKPVLDGHLEDLRPSNLTQKVFAFCVKLLANLWTSAFLLFVARWALLRPVDVRPMLGASVVHQFELLGQAPPGPGLGFNFTTHLLFKNTHRIYTVGYDHPAAAVFYAGEKLGPSDDGISPFRQDILERRVVSQAVVGRLRNASDAVVGTFAAEETRGRFEMVVKIRVTLAYKSWPWKEEFFTLYDCPLSLPAVPKTGHPVLSTPAYCNAVES